MVYSCISDHTREQSARIFQQTGLFPPTLVPLAAARTTGAQCIQRSELYAVTRVVELFPASCTHTDSTWAMHTVSLCKSARTLSQLQHLADFDLVERLFNCPSLDDHILHKVKAHVDPHTVSHLLTAYHTLGNQLVNDKAIQACWNFLPELVHEYHALHLQYELEKEQLTFYYRFLLELFQRRKHLESRSSDEGDAQQVQTTQMRVDFFILLSEWTVCKAWTMPPCHFQISSEGTWGRSLTTAVVQWLAECTWPDGTPDSRDTFGVTWLELTTSFLLYIGRWLPLKRSVGGNSEAILIFDSASQATMYGVEVSEQVRGFCQLFGQANDLAQSEIWPKLPRGLVRSAYLLGAPTQPAGVKMRPSFPFQSRVCSILRDYFRQNPGVAYKVLPELSFGSPLHSTAQLKVEMAGWHLEE